MVLSSIGCKFLIEAMTILNVLGGFWDEILESADTCILWVTFRLLQSVWLVIKKVVPSTGVVG